MSQKESPLAAVNESLKSWQQGDCAKVEGGFIYGYDVELPATPASQELEPDSENPFAVEVVKGFVVITQTCDIIKDVEKRHYVEVSPLVEVDAGLLKQIKSRNRPQFAEVPALTEQSLVADLDRVMTLEKPVLVKWNRIEGCRNDKEKRNFSEALARKCSRPALPNDFVDLLKPLQKHWIKTHDKTTDEGRALQALREIRVQPSPSWDSSKIKVRFWFILDSLPSEGSEPSRSTIEKFADDWIKKLKPDGTRFEVDYSVNPYSDMGADEYVASDQLDYDYLSG